ncbi:MAG: undecaprenyl-phosphate glucose phosphotransferase [Nitrospina sp.]|nr:undecaprenyl-phosphate glucose phosphotransferase [Nitrospina sp.]MBT6718340.1 undecaprenyl-phosphate glucose phosphotransferase [Nitrospina sp.]
MIRKHSQVYSTAIFFFNSFAVALAWLCAYLFRFELELFSKVSSIPTGNMYFYALLPIWFVFYVNSRVLGHNKPISRHSPTSEYLSILKLTSLSVLLLTAGTFFYREFSFSRIMTVYFWIFANLFLLLSHRLVRFLVKEMHSRGMNLRKVLVLGAGDLGQRVVEKLDMHPEIGFSVVGYLTHNPVKVGSEIDGYKVLGLYEDINRCIKENEVSQLFIALPINAHDRMTSILASLEEETVDIKLVPDLLRYMDLQSGIEDLDGMPLINLTESPLYGWNTVLKRASDIILSGFAILISFPVMVLIAIAIKLTSRGPLLYMQERMGLDRDVFRMYKFRSMKIGAENQTGPVWAKEDDDRRTIIGTFLRSTSLDELPQFFNVFMGQMSLVGPRPERPVFVDEFKKSIPFYMLRLKMKAGLTGWAQVNGWRGNTSLEKRIEFDLYYIKNWSLLFDIKILFLTIWKGLINRHAY